MSMDLFYHKSIKYVLPDTCHPWTVSLFYLVLPRQKTHPFVVMASMTRHTCSLHHGCIETHKGDLLPNPPGTGEEKVDPGHGQDVEVRIVEHHGNLPPALVQA